ncbi:hypothetical protein B7P43_G07815 [Cryptotermes secundus]|uniref:GRIP domain-containing protein n=1 Tax=Cryptotermes secundus TaxID=105785 RepID=A0A2J7QLA2_9NEOP|nr:GRIP and coiled-coil domain-containing protein 2 isoform X2 [Cryptotermes secundus]PNF29357.1 hypothetical protein B7P43_G07815 [Cryptotermes secundus]
MDGTAKDTDGAQKRNSLEDLNKEDLIKKCKSLLVIAQRAKQAKDDAGKEIIRLKEQLNTLQMQAEQVHNGERYSDTGRNEKELQLQNEVSAMQEMLTTLTEQKLCFTMEVDKLKKENVTLEKELNQLKLEKASVQEISAQLHCQLGELETAAESYKRQIHRLTNENEALIKQMERLEMEMKKKEDQTSQVSHDQVKLLEGELQMLHDEVERLNGEDAQKKEQMKQLYETFSKEKSELKRSLENETRQFQQMRSGLILLSSEAYELNVLRMRLSEEVRMFQSDVFNMLQEDTWIAVQKVVMNYVESEIAATKRENSELLGEMNEMNQVLKHRGETVSKLNELNSELEHRLKETNSKLEATEKDLKVKLSELEIKGKALCDLEMDLAKVTKAQQEDMHMKDETIFTLEKEIVKFMECQHELETKTSALEAKEERIHNLEAELAKQVDTLQELKSKDKIITDLEEQIRNLKVVNKAGDREEDGCSTEDCEMKVKLLKDEISTLKGKLQVLEHEIEEMRKENGDVPSEVMSSSTISRAEENARLKDLEETFEERYTKLRAVAVRLKKRVSELTAQQTHLEMEKKKLVSDKSELQAKVAQLSAHAKNLQTMHLEYDRLQDDMEKQKLEVKEFAKALELAVNESATLKVQLLECQEEKECKLKDLEACVKDKQRLELANKELSSHIHSLKKEKEAENIARKENEKELKRLEEELKASEKRLTEEVDHHKNTQEQLDVSRQECKKHSVLSLEMEDYERSVADLTQQLVSQKSKVKELDSHLETQQDINRGLQEQISLLEQRIQSEEARSKEVKEQLNASRRRLLEVEALALEREAMISELLSQIEQHKGKSENLVLQLSELAAEKQRLVECGQNQQDNLNRQVHVLEQHVSRLKENLVEREAELGDLRAEFTNYKVRAQSVLRQKARPDDGSSSLSREDHTEEVAQLKQTAEILKSKLEDVSSKLQSLMVENSALQEDQARVLQRYQELSDTVQDLRNQNSQLHTQLQEAKIEHREALRSQKLQAETLNQCYKQQIEELEERLQKETSALKKQLQDTEEQLHRIQQHSSVVGDVVGHVMQPAESNMLNTPSKHNASPHWNSSTVGFIPVRSGVIMNQQDSENKLEITLLEREEGEGSESVDSTPPHLSASQERRTELIPLEKLLSSPADDENNVSTVSASPGVELSQTKEQLVVSECRIRHLSGLLSEAERDLAKLTQQNQVLKDEIRRQQRSVEREQHAQNFEYLKNIVLKFVTLQGGDERSRLVPVLNTILKLSPEETSQLNIVAKGGPDLQAGGRGWGSYLHLWSGTQ